MLDFRVETFLCVCRHMNFTKAARELSITQPGVTQHIHYLEQYYGCKLFAYSGKLLSLTPAGEELKNAMLAMKHDNMHLKNRIREEVEKVPPLLFGSTLTIGEFFVPLRLAEYMKRNPSVHIRMIVNNTKELLHLLDEGKIDFALLEGYFPQHEYESLRISVEDYIAAAGSGYRAEIRQMSDLFSHRLLLREAGSGSREILEHYLMEKGYSVEDFYDRAEISNIHALKELAKEGCGLTFLYRIAAEKELESGSLREIALPGGRLTHEFRFVWRKSSIYKEYYEKICGEIFQKEIE